MSSETRVGGPVPRSCPECDGRVRRDGTDDVCEECGLVLGEDALDRGPEPTYAGQDGTPERTGAPLTEARHDRGLTTSIGHKRDAHGSRLSAAKRSQLRRLRRQHHRATLGGKDDRNLSAGFREIDRMGSALGVPDGRREQACRLFRSAQRADVLLGRSIEGVAAACLYAASRIDGGALLLSDVARVARVDELRIERAYRNLNRELDLPASPPTPSQYVPQVASAVDCGASVRRAAETFADAWQDAYPSKAVNPAGVAAAAVYVASTRLGERVSRDAVCEAVDVCRPTLRARRDELRTVDAPVE